MNSSHQHLYLPAGTLLFTEGELGDVAYLIRGGQVEIFLRRDEGDVVLACRGAGEIIGEMAIIDRLPRSASARIVVDCELVPITAAQIEHRMAATDPILRMCLGVVIDRYRETVALVQGGADAPASASPRTGEPVFRAAVEVLTLERELERALHDEEFEIYFQPIVHLASRRLAGFEALMRWNHPTRGLVMPAQFIPIAEANGFITRLTDWALCQVARVFPAIAAAARSNPAAQGADLFVSANVSGHDLAQPGFAERVQAILAAAGMAPENLKLEITESLLMRDPACAGRVLDACRSGGMGIAIDDFGTGYSSLSYLSTLPISTLKVDRAFVRSMVSDATSAKIVGTILHLARDLDVPVVAEGIEREVEAALLTALACEYGQGYLFGRPVALPEALGVARAWSPAQDHAAPDRAAGLALAS